MEQPSQVSGNRILRAIVRTVVEGNLLYVFSAVAMLTGCFLLMKSPLIDGTEYVRVLKAAATLQAYELLIVATAVAIMRRFREVGDAFGLLLIELVLVFDPVFFKNNFISMLRYDADPMLIVGTVSIMYGLGIAKVAALSYHLGFRFRRASQLALLVGGAIVYLLPLPFGSPELTRADGHALLFLLGLAFVGLCAVTPPQRDAVAVHAPGASDRMVFWFPKFVSRFPLLFVLAHQIETGIVNGVKFLPLHLVPALIAGAVLLARRVRIVSGPVLVAAEFLLLFGVLFGREAANRIDVGAFGEGHSLALTGWLLGDVPVWITFAIAAAIYTGLWLRQRETWIAARLPLLVVAACAYHFHAERLVLWLIEWVRSLPITPAEFLFAAFTGFLGIVAVIEGILSRKLDSIVIGAICGAVSAGLATPGNQLLLSGGGVCALLAVQASVGKERPKSVAIFVLGVLSAVLTLAQQKFHGTDVLPFAIAQAVAFAAIGIRWRNLGVLALFAIGAFFALGRYGEFDAALVWLLAGLALFGLGVLVTFRRESLNAYLATPLPIPEPISEPVPESEAATPTPPESKLE